MAGVSFRRSRPNAAARRAEALCPGAACNPLALEEPVPVLVESPYPKRLSRAAAAGPVTAAGAPAVVDIALVNNMPDAAMETTVRQFLSVLDPASPDVAVRLQLFSFPGLPCSDWRRQHLSNHYSDFDDLLSGRFDGLIVTGTEPRAAALTAEPYWADLARLVDWADANTFASAWSCLAAHAAVQHLDGIPRTPLEQKCFGLFAHARVADHWLLRGQPARIVAPHSRWNGLSSDALAAAGYRVLSASPAGVDIFIRQRRSLLLLFQGHPEYDADTLAREYRRDVGRFLRGERESYPDLPERYFSAAIADMLDAFRALAEAARGEDLMSAFPSQQIFDAVPHAWYTQAVRTYTNWLNYIVECRTAAQPAPRRASAG